MNSLEIFANQEGYQLGTVVVNELTDKTHESMFLIFRFCLETQESILFSVSREGIKLKLQTKHWWGQSKQ